MVENWIKVSIKLVILAILLSVLIHYASSIILIFSHGEVAVYEPNKIILVVEFIFDIMAMIYVIYSIVETAKV